MKNNMTQLTRHVNNDIGNSIFFPRELEQIKPGSYDVEYAPLSYLTMIPTSRTTPVGAKFVTYTQYNSTGLAKIVSNYADDIPLVGLEGKQFTSKIVRIADAYLMSEQDMQSSTFANKSMEQKLMQTASEVIQQRMNQLAFFGDTAYGVQGWLTNTTIDKQPVAGADANARKWINKDGPEMVQDIVEAYTKIRSDTSNVEIPDTVGLPVAQFLRLQETQYQAGTDTTALEWLLRNNPGLRVVVANELKGAFSGLDGMVVYKQSERKFWQEVPVAFAMFPPQPDNMAFKVICYADYGGVIVAYPQSQAFRTGI